MPGAGQYTCDPGIDMPPTHGKKIAFVEVCIFINAF